MKETRTCRAAGFSIRCIHRNSHGAAINLPLIIGLERGEALLIDEYRGPAIWHWPLIVDADPARLDRITAAALGHLMDEVDFPLPDLTESPPQEPPEFLHLMDWRQGNEYILEPHPPRIWRMQIDANDDCVGITWCQGFGLPPEFPRDTRRVTAFHASDEFDTQTILRDE